ncbi:MAG: AAA family ATPase [Oligosphaeraceae bacterium]
MKDERTDDGREKRPDEEQTGESRSTRDPWKELRDLMDRLGGIPLGSIRLERNASGDEEKERDDAPRVSPLDVIRNFSLKPREIRDNLDRYVISQDEAKKVLATAVCDHYNHARRCLEDPEMARRDYPKANVLMMGPTGVGKTYLMRCIARLVGVPFVKADATKFSETGYVGYDVEDIVRDLVKAANGNVELAQFGIVYIDEVDKLASRGGDGQKDVSGRGVQVNLLKLLEDSEVRLIAQNDMMGQMQAMMSFQRNGERPPSTISTKFILFIVSGAFSKLDALVKRRLGNGSIGFRTAREGEGAGEEGGDDASAGSREAALLQQVQTADLVNYGFEPEFVGRFPVRVALEELGEPELERILTTAENGIWEQYVTAMEGYGIHLTAEPEALREIAREAAGERTGARGLLTVLERFFRDFKFELPGTGVTELPLTRAMMEHPRQALEELLQANAQKLRHMACPEVDAFAQRFQEKTGYTLVFSPGAKERLGDLASSAGKSVGGFCEGHFRDFHYGLPLVEKNHPGCREFFMDKEDVEDPGQALTRWIREGVSPSS